MIQKMRKGTIMLMNMLPTIEIQTFTFAMAHYLLATHVTSFVDGRDSRILWNGSRIVYVLGVLSITFIWNRS